MTKGRVTRRRVEIVLALACLLVSGPAAAQSAAEFYKGKQIDMYIGTPTGGGYDQYGRLLGRHMSRHIPGNPMIVYRNMPAGGGRQAITTSTTWPPPTGLRSASRSATSGSIRCTARPRR